MDTLTNYRQIIEKILKEYAASNSHFEKNKVLTPILECKI